MDGDGRAGRPGCDYGSESWGFESLRAGKDSLVSTFRLGNGQSPLTSQPTA